MVSAWSTTNHVVLGQVKTDEKFNEITAIPALLDPIDVGDALVTIDAAGAQVEIADKIVEKGGDYLLALKGNQPTLHAGLVEHFTGGGVFARDLDFDEARDHGHGREEPRRVWVSDDNAGLPSALRWRGLATVVRVESTRIVNGEASVEDRYYIRFDLDSFGGHLGARADSGGRLRSIPLPGSAASSGRHLYLSPSSS